MNLYQGLLFLHGHIADADLARRLADGHPAQTDPAAPSAPATRSLSAPPAAASRAPRRRRRWRALLRNLWLLGGRPMTAGCNDDRDEAFAQLRCAQRLACRALAAGGFR